VAAHTQSTDVLPHRRAAADSLIKLEAAEKPADLHKKNLQSKGRNQKTRGKMLTQ
jgi:hypothetical protein